MLTECSSSGSLLKTSLETWSQFDSFFVNNPWETLHPALCAINKTELRSQVYILQATIFDDQPLISQYSFELYTALIPVLHCICSALCVREGH